MKIAIFSDNFYPELSGIADSLDLLGKTLTERGHSILYVAPYYRDQDYLIANVPKKAELTGTKRLLSINYANSPNGQGRIVLPYGGAVRAIRKFAPDIIHTNTPFGTGLEALVAAKLLGIPLIGTNHTPSSEFSAYSPIKTNWFNTFTSYYFSWYYNRCQYVTGPCNSLLNEMKPFGFHRPHSALPNPLDVSRFKPAASKEEKDLLRKRLGFTFPTILYTGRLAEEKHVDVIIRAVAKVREIIPNASFALTGHGGAEKKLRTLAEGLSLTEHVNFLGFVDEATLPLLYQASDVFVIMSTAESQSLSLMQAMASGLPVIGANSRALPEYITPENGLVVKVGDADALAKALVSILQNSNYAEKLSKGGPLSAALCERTTITEKWEVLYAEVIANYHKQKNKKYIASR